MTISETKKVDPPLGRVKTRNAQVPVEASEERKQMESRLRFGTVICFMLAIAFGVCCLYASVTAGHRRDELHRGLTHRSRFVDAVNHIHPNRILEQLKSDICQSGTYVRDFLLEPEPGHADLHKQEFDGARERVQAMLNEYTGIPLPAERTALRQFSRELKAYFDVDERSRERRGSGK